jgi:hypothetical protein
VHELTVAGWIVTSIVAVGLIAGCGSTDHARPVARSPQGPARAACATRSVAVLARASGLAARSIHSAPFTALDGSASCRFSARTASQRMSVVVEIDTAPQAYYRLEREAVEYGQNVLWHHQPESAYPQYVLRVGVEADWFPAERTLMATDDQRLITVTTSAAAKGLAADVARVYLRDAKH